MLHKELECFLASVTDHWGQGTKVKDLGPDILNLIADPENNYDSWEDEPELDDKLATTQAEGD